MGILHIIFVRNPNLKEYPPTSHAGISVGVPLEVGLFHTRSEPNGNETGTKRGFNYHMPNLSLKN